MLEECTMPRAEPWQGFGSQPAGGIPPARASRHTFTTPGWIRRERPDGGEYLYFLTGGRDA